MIFFVLRGLVIFVIFDPKRLGDFFLSQEVGYFFCCLKWLGIFFVPRGWMIFFVLRGWVIFVVPRVVVIFFCHKRFGDFFLS